ncbi:MAG: hypothetical protein ACYDAD_05750, partial [Acidimicrobiales bacterium]
MLRRHPGLGQRRALPARAPLWSRPRADRDRAARRRPRLLRPGRQGHGPRRGGTAGARQGAGLRRTHPAAEGSGRRAACLRRHGGSALSARRDRRAERSRRRHRTGQGAGADGR